MLREEKEEKKVFVCEREREHYCEERKSEIFFVANCYKAFEGQ